MLIKMLVGKRKTEDEFKKYITRVACSLLSLGVLGLFIIRSNNLSDYALGLVLGLTIGVYVLSIYYFATLTHSKRLHRMYIAAYDEQNKQILMATAVATLILEFLLIFALIALYAFVNIQLPYVTVLSVLLYGLVLGFACLLYTSTSAFLDRLKDLGYYHSTLAGLTVGIADIPVIDNKQEIIDAAHHRVEEINKAFRRGLMLSLIHI